MLFTLVRKEILTNLLTLRLGVAVIFTVVLSVLTTFIGSLNYSQNLRAYENEVRQVAESLDRATIYSQLVPRPVLPPQPLAILCRGLIGPAGQTVYIGVGRIVRSSDQLNNAFDSEFMKTLVQIDFTTVVALLLSFLAIVLGFDGICGERESGTLRQLLANPIPRAHVVLGKMLGGMISLWIPFALAFVISLLIILSNSDVALSGEDWLRLGLFFGLSCLFLEQIFAFRLDVNKAVRKRIGARKVSFAGPEESLTLTGMTSGGVTPFGLPEDLPIWIDHRVIERDIVVFGGGNRTSKIKVSPKIFEGIDNAEVIENLALQKT